MPQCTPTQHNNKGKNQAGWKLTIEKFWNYSLKQLKIKP
jgi:hypothetical protein